MSLGKSDAARARRSLDHAVVVRIRTDCGRQQRGFCFWCDRPIDESLWTLEHLVPQSHRGRTIHRNCVMACEPCNTSRQARELIGFLTVCALRVDAATRRDFVINRAKRIASAINMRRPGLLVKEVMDAVEKGTHG